MELLRSKKFQMTIAGIIAVIITQYVPAIDGATANQIAGVVAAYLLAQGAADFGKAAK